MEGTNITDLQSDDVAFNSRQKSGFTEIVVFLSTYNSTRQQQVSPTSLTPWCVICPGEVTGKWPKNFQQLYEKRISSLFFRTSGFGREANKSPWNACFTRFTEIRWDGLDWIYMAQDRSMWQALANRVTKLRVPQNVGNFLTSWESAVPWGRTAACSQSFSSRLQSPHSTEVPYSKSFRAKEEENSLKFTGLRWDIYDTRSYTRTNCVSY